MIFDLGGFWISESGFQIFLWGFDETCLVKGLAERNM